MQPILAAESAPHRGRAIALASAGLIAVLALATAIHGHHHAAHRTHHGHHRLHVTGHCSTTVYLVR